MLQFGEGVDLALVESFESTGLLLLLGIRFFNPDAVTLRSCPAGRLSPSGRLSPGIAPGRWGCKNLYDLTEEEIKLVGDLHNKS